MKRYRFKKILKGIERLILRLLVVGLVLLVAVQFILTNSNVEQKLVAKIPWTRKLLTLGQQNEFSQSAKQVFSTRQQYIKLSLQNNLQLRKVQVLVNGQVVGNFSQSEIKVNIKPGDRLAIDARGCQQGLWFEIDSLSTAISFLQTGQQFWLKDEYKVLGKVRNQNKF